MASGRDLTATNKRLIEERIRAQLRQQQDCRLPSRLPASYSHEYDKLRDRRATYCHSSIDSGCGGGNGGGGATATITSNLNYNYCPLDTDGSCDCSSAQDISSQPATAVSFCRQTSTNSSSTRAVGRQLVTVSTSKLPSASGQTTATTTTGPQVQSGGDNKLLIISGRQNRQQQQQQQAAADGGDEFEGSHKSIKPLVSSSMSSSSGSSTSAGSRNATKSPPPPGEQCRITLTRASPRNQQLAGGVGGGGACGNSSLDQESNIGDGKQFSPLAQKLPPHPNSKAKSCVTKMISAAHHHHHHSSGGGGVGGQKPLKKRENWDKNIEFLLAVIGFAVDLGNVWRFPYICYKNGGGAFLIPYTVMFILGGLPIFYLEMSLGQLFSSGCLTVWRRVCPMAKGIGYAMCVLNFFTGLYYNTIISWAVFFFVESFTSELPWTSCNNSWNSPDCKTISERQMTRWTSLANTAATGNSSSSSGSNIMPSQWPITATNLSSSSPTPPPPLVHYSSPTKDYFEREVLHVHLSTGIDDLGSIRTPLAVYLAIVFICIYFAIWKGVKSTGKAVWITALLPYFVLIPLLIRGVLLEGAWLGIKYYLYPDWIKILNVDVWVEAAKQIYFSLGPGFGTLMALSSYNKFNHNCQKDALIAASVNYFASFISGLVIFAVLGYMATFENVSVEDVATEGPGLVFQVYPEGLATMRFSAMWSVLFFIMVITLGIDSTFGGLESVITGLCDEYPRTLRAHRGIFIGLLIIIIYLCSLPTTTYGGNYVIFLLESYGTALSLLFIVLCEIIVVCWIYGTDKFCGDLKRMSGKRPGAYWRICWKYISPTLSLLIFMAACLQEWDKYHTLSNGDYTFPGWAPTVGLLMTGASVCCVPIYAIYYLKTKTSGCFLERLRAGYMPREAEQDEADASGYADIAGSIDKIRDHNDTLLDTDI